MSYKPGDPYYTVFSTANPSTGAAQNADSLPTATVFHNGTIDSSFVLTVLNLSTGLYRITGTIPSGYASGDVFEVTVAATVAGVAGVAPLDGQVLDGKRVADLHDFNGGAVASVTAAVTVGGYSTGQDPATLLLTTPANKLKTVSGGLVQLDLTQAVPTSNTAQTTGDCFNAGRAQGFGKWVLSGTTLTLYAADGSTVVRTFTLDSASSPTQRT